MARLAVKRAAEVLAGGGVVAYPTEGVYGLGCDPEDPEAVTRLLALKGRQAAKGLILLAGAAEDLEGFVGPLDERAAERVRTLWPGPVTLVLPAGPRAPETVTGGRATVAARVTAHPLAAALSRAFGKPVISTSANRSGGPPARSALGVRRRFGEGVDFVLAGRLGGAAGPTPIIDGTSGAVLRPPPRGDSGDGGQ